MPFSWQPWLPFTLLVYYTTNKRLGVYAQLRLQDWRLFGARR